MLFKKHKYSETEPLLGVVRRRFNIPVLADIVIGGGVDEIDGDDEDTSDSRFVERHLLKFDLLTDDPTMDFPEEFTEETIRAGITAEELKEQGLTKEELRIAGLNNEQLQMLGFDVSEELEGVDSRTGQSIDVKPVEEQIDGIKFR